MDLKGPMTGCCKCGLAGMDLEELSDTSGESHFKSSGIFGILEIFGTHVLNWC